MSVKGPYDHKLCYIGLSTDTKPTVGVLIGTEFFESNTGLWYIFDGSSWSQSLSSPVLGQSSLSDPDIAHGMTDLFGTTIYGAFTTISGTIGGLDIYGLTDADQAGALRLTGIIGAADPTDTYAALWLRGGKKNGTTWQALDAAETVFILDNYTTNLIAILGDGKVGLGTNAPGYAISHRSTANNYFSIGQTAGHLLFGWQYNATPANAVGKILVNSYSQPLHIDASYIALNANNTNHLVLIGDTTNAQMTSGLTINQGTAADEILTLKSGNVGHSFTGITETDSFLTVKNLSTTLGGVNFTAYTDGDATALQLRGAIGVADPTDTTAAVTIVGGKLSGTTIGALGSAETVFKLSNYTTDLLTVFGDGAISVTKNGVVNIIGSVSSVSKSSTYAIIDTDGYETIFVSGTFTLTLPSASKKRIIKLKKTDISNSLVTVAALGTDTIEGDANMVLEFRYDSVILESDGSSTWYKF